MADPASPRQRPDPRNRFAEMLDDLQGSQVGQAMRPMANAVTSLADNPYVQKAQGIGQALLNPFGAIGEATTDAFNPTEPDADDTVAAWNRLPPTIGAGTFGESSRFDPTATPTMLPSEMEMPQPPSPELLATRDLPVMGSPEQMAMFTRPEGGYNAVPSWGPNAGEGFQMPTDNMDEALDAYQMMQLPSPKLPAKRPPPAMAPGGQRGPMRSRR